MSELIDVTQILHDTRTAYLRDINVDGKTMVSVGANGHWYFEWIHANCGLPKRHIGVELFLPKPDYLPPNSEWIANTAGDMSDVDSGVADVLFSGQNIEHLWEEDVSKFVLEANRVLKTDGILIVDSPNRTITEALCIIHPEHMVELTPDEMTGILTAAGFETVLRRGIFLTRDPRNKQILPYQPDHAWAGSWSLVERCALSDRHVDDCYIWWIEARKTGAAADPAKVRELVRAYWEKGWPERMNRFKSALGEALSGEEGLYYVSKPGQQGAVSYGPYAPVLRGNYRASMRIAVDDVVDPDTAVGIMDIVIDEKVLESRTLFARDLLKDGYTEISIPFSTTLDTSFGLQCRVIANGAAGLRVLRGWELERL